MRTPIADRRLELVSVLGKRAGDLFRLERGKLRFALGTSLADLKLPFHVTPETAGFISQAALQLVVLLTARHKALLPPDDYDRLLLSEQFSEVSAPPSELSTAATNQDIRATAELALSAHARSRWLCKMA